MSINIGPPAVEELRPRITVIGVGGAGGNGAGGEGGAGAPDGSLSESQRMAILWDMLQTAMLAEQDAASAAEATQKAAAAALCALSMSHS